MVKYTVKSLVYLSNPPHRYLELAKGPPIGTLFRLFDGAADQYQLNNFLGFDGRYVGSVRWCRATNIVNVTDSTLKDYKNIFMEVRHVRDAHKLLEMLKRSLPSSRGIEFLTM